MSNTSNSALPEAHSFRVGEAVSTTGGLQAVVERTDGENVVIRTEDGMRILASAWALWHAKPGKA